MGNKFLNSKILHLVYILVPSPYDYTSIDKRQRQLKSLPTNALQQGKEDRCGMCPQTTSEANFEKKRRNISRIIHKFVLIYCHLFYLFYRKSSGFTSRRLGDVSR